MRGPGALLQKRYFPAACFGAAFLIRVVWMLLVDPKPLSDFDWYYARGIDMSLGRGLQEHGVPTAYWPVGYPAFLGALFALFGKSLLVAKIANLLLYMGVIALSYWLAGRLFRSTLTARLTLLILAFYPNHIAYTSLVASESLWAFLMLLGIALLLLPGSRSLMAILSGITFGLACLVRPQLLPVPLIALLLLPRGERPRPLGERLLTLAGVYATILVVLVPWTIRNYRAFGHVVLVSTNAGGNLLTGNNPWADGTYMERPEFTEIVGPGNEYEKDRRAKSYAIDYIREHPLATLKLMPRKLWYLYRGDIEGIRWSTQGIEAKGERVPKGLWTAIEVVAEGYYLLMIAACATTLLLVLQSKGVGAARASFPLLGIGFIGYFTLLGLIFYGGSRYHFPVMFWVAMYAASLPEALRERRI